MPRAALSFYDNPTSPVMCREAVRQFLGMDEKQLRREINLGHLVVDQCTGLFARKQVVDLAELIAQRIMENDGATLGRQEQTMGGVDRIRREPSLVPVKN